MHLRSKDVADALGISETTVSRALSGKGRVSPKTVTRVREYVRIHGTPPDNEK